MIAVGFFAFSDLYSKDSENMYVAARSLKKINDDSVVLSNLLCIKSQSDVSGGATGFKKEDFKLRKEIIESENPDAISIGGGTYARALKHGVAFGPEFPGVESTIHMPDERTPISTYMNVFKIYREAIRRLCF